MNVVIGRLLAYVWDLAGFNSYGMLARKVKESLGALNHLRASALRGQCTTFRIYYWAMICSLEKN